MGVCCNTCAMYQGQQNGSWCLWRQTFMKPDKHFGPSGGGEEVCGLWPLRPIPPWTGRHTPKMSP